MAEPTVADFRRAARSASKRLRLEQVIATVAMPSYSDWADNVEQAIAIAGSKLATKRNYLAPSEDNLTSALLLMLDGLGFDAEMLMVNGNCDVVVKLEDYLWLGEAKLDTSVSWLWKGYLQLTTRYATGQRLQDRGGMIIYCVNDAVPTTMAGWKAALAAELAQPEDEFECWAGSDQAFRSEVSVLPTGRPMIVLHQGVAMLHAPQDPSAKLSQRASAAARQARDGTK